MTTHINAEIISIGTEILLGEITDTNSVHIARLLRDIGVNVFYMTSVGDNLGRIAGTVQQAMARSDVVITCGGLGPTVDDMTRQAVAQATARELVFEQRLLDQISARFRNFRVQMTENNRRQAFVPQDALVIENPVGTAPSFMIEYHGSIVICLPGVPREMLYLMKERVIPLLQARYSLGIIKARVLRTAGIGESSLDELIGATLLEGSNPTVGLAAHNGQVDIRVTAKADTLTDAERMIDVVESELRQRVGRYIFGKDDDRLEKVVVEALRQNGATLAVTETGINGVIASALSGLNPEVVIATQTYATPVELHQALALTEPLTARGLALAAAQALRASTNATIVIAIVSDPDADESVDTDEMTSVVVQSGDDIRQRSYGFGARSELARRWVTTWALASIWWYLRDAQLS